MIDRRAFLAALAASAALPLRAQPDAPAPVTAQGDIDILRSALVALHPGLFRYQSPAAFERRYRALRAWAGRPRELGALFVAIARFCATLRCGHTYPNPNNQPRSVRETLFSRRDRIPFGFAWIDGRMIVTRLLAESPLRPGDEVSALDGIPVRRILEALLPLARADGGNDAKRVVQMAVAGTGRFESFDVYRPLLFPPPYSGQVEIALRGRADKMLLPALTEADRQHTGSGQGASPWRFDLSDGVGRLAMPTWALYDSAFDWRAFLASAMDRLAAGNARGLIVDLRGNEGGLDCGDPLLARLIGAPLARPAYRRRVRYRTVPAALSPMLTTYDDGFRDWGARAIGPDAEGFYDLAGEDDSTIVPAGPRFRGRTVILSDASNSSATFLFLDMAKDNRLATIVGAPSGGNRRGINGDAFFFLRLPASGIEVDLPLVGRFAAEPRPDAGILPDIAAAPDRAAIAAGRDPVMDRALSLLG